MEELKTEKAKLLAEIATARNGGKLDRTARSAVERLGVLRQRFNDTRLELVLINLKARSKTCGHCVLPRID